MNDMRDEALATVLERAARATDPDPGGRLDDVLRRGGRRRAFRLAAIGTVVLVSAGAVAWAGLTWPQERSVDPAQRVTVELPATPWTFTVAPDWRPVGTMASTEEPLVNLTRTTIVNGEPPSAVGAVTAGEPGSRALTSATGDAGVFVIVDRRWGTVRPLPLERYQRVGGTSADPESPGWTYRWRDRCLGTLCFTVTVWWGPEASDADLAEAARIEESIRRASDVRWTEAGASHTTLHDEVRGFTVTHPNGWVTADENLTPWLMSPVETLSLGTFPLRVSNDPEAGLRLFDAPVAPQALADMSSTDVFVSLQESGESFTGPPLTRPQHFGPRECEIAVTGCEKDRYREIPFRAWWIPFEDAGRGLYMFVAIGNDATPELEEQVWAVADSLTFLRA